MAQQKSPHLALQLGAITLARLFINSSIRMVYPFLPALARGLALPLTDLFLLVQLRNFAGLLSPLFGPLSERFGHKPVIAGAVLLFSAACLLVAVWPAYWLLGLTLAAISLAKVIYDPAVHAYLGGIVPYKQRGRAIAVTEFSWAGALLIGAPAVGFVIQRQGWQAPFFWLGALGVGATVVLWRTLPAGSRQMTEGSSIAGIVRIVRRYPVIWAAAVYTLLAMAANEVLTIVYGTWMEGSFDLTLTDLGLASGIIGGAEITGEVFTGIAVDRFGKRPVIIMTGILTAFLYFLIPYTSVSLWAALPALFALFLAFEITVVGGIPLLTEIVPTARGVVMSITVAASYLGRTIGALIGPVIWQRGGLTSTGSAAAVIMVVAVVILGRWVHEGVEARLESGS